MNVGSHIRLHAGGAGNVHDRLTMMRLTRGGGGDTGRAARRLPGLLVLVHLRLLLDGTGLGGRSVGFSDSSQ